jgi:hypothetical protein
MPLDHPWHNNTVSFNNKVETREAPEPLSGAQVLEQYDIFEQVEFGKTLLYKKGSVTKAIDGTTGGRRVFFELPYWSSLLIRHNLDVMHIEKNICESILGTLLKLDDKCKDGENARLDMEHLWIQPDQHPVIKDDKYTLPSALYELNKEARESLCEFLYGVNMLDGVSSNIRRCVDVKSHKVSVLKTHDYHLIL